VKKKLQESNFNNMNKYKSSYNFPIIYVILILLTFSAIGYGQNGKKSDNQKDDVGPLDLGITENTSLIRLIATPEKYDGKTIQVVGYLHLEFEGNALYLHKEDYENNLDNNAFWVSFSENIKKRDLKKYNDIYVIIIGTFRMNDKGHLGLFGGTLDNIVRLDPVRWR
jgi:hypothetical protein